MSVPQLDKNKGSIDENGVRYLVFVKRHVHLNRILPPALRREVLEYRDIVWALHSDSQVSFYTAVPLGVIAKYIKSASSLYIKTLKHIIMTLCRISSLITA